MNSSKKESLMNLNMNISEIRVPRLAIKDTVIIEEGLRVIKNPVAKGARNPNAKIIPARKILKKLASEGNIN